MRTSESRGSTSESPSLGLEASSCRGEARYPKDVVPYRATASHDPMSEAPSFAREARSSASEGPSFMSGPRSLGSEAPSFTEELVRPRVKLRPSRVKVLP